MGGHGGLNILPQKRWNVYNYENREKVRRDEEAAAKEEQLKREQSRKRDAEFRLEQLRTARGIAPVIDTTKPVETDLKPGHLNLFEGIKIFDPVKSSENEGGEDGSKKKRMKREEVEKRVITAEDEKYKLGYGVAGKGVKLPWYLERRSKDDAESDQNDSSPRVVSENIKKGGKKTLEELRAERLKREQKEKGRERALIAERSGKSGTTSRERDSSSRRWKSRRYDSGYQDH
ncbi:leukocyte receptor cluster member 1 homolog [Cucurbita moschata]|uniref:Leukocyte receptor cluster member 1 homolog n=1 Tax=Cucurbita moschata TaxID=3662 RepID=A0A6J1E3T1_CUCMO|nr:leukocyte receptor cluster member 1 homolog [Cucurbita moschata]XP_022922310.1 leukocyte receptor cluster member 1 homolog [Cucurbita moschata]XP_022922311.1 leukocyte receptor cluster member 1 homolog [Cucurbita moschata]XP_022922313.1 leukocyte receptor cluster member 1 homolog [Cucurbita moschata]